MTVTRNYYALVAAERSARRRSCSCSRRRVSSRSHSSRSRGGLVPHSDVVRAEIQFRQQQQSYADATLAMENARLVLAVLLFPTLNETSPSWTT